MSLTMSWTVDIDAAYHRTDWAEVTNVAELVGCGASVCLRRLLFAAPKLRPKGMTDKHNVRT